jgi:hypothetical protein
MFGRCRGTLRAMVELAVPVAAVAGVGLTRPRWSSLLVAFVPAGLAFLWLLLHEDVPGEDISAKDIAWYAVMSGVVAAAFALSCALGVIAGRAFRQRRRRVLR